MPKKRKRTAYNYLARPSTALHPVSARHRGRYEEDFTPPPEPRVRTMNVLQSNMGAIGDPLFVKDYFNSGGTTTRDHARIEGVGATVKALDYRRLPD